MTFSGSNDKILVNYLHVYPTKLSISNQKHYGLSLARVGGVQNQPKSAFFLNNFYFILENS